jgi:hypothetical protein
MKRSCPSCGQPIASGDADAACPACATAWTQGAVARLTILTRSAGGTDTAAGAVELPPEFRARYRVMDTLGRGAMGMVVLAERVSDGAKVAVKFLLGTSPELLARFVREGELLAAIDHPNVVRVLETVVVGAHPCLVCEYLEGGTLRERLRAEGRLAPSVAAKVTADLLAGLSACHERGIVHRDVKPENVLFDASGNAKMADLGIAKHYGAEGPTLTSTGQLIGTPRYMAPEQIRGEPAGVASDLYSIGLLLYEMLAGSPPFIAPSVVELARQHTFDPPPPLPSDVEVPPAVGAALDRALAKSPADRPPTAQDFARALRATARPSARTRAPAQPASRSGARAPSHAPRRARRVAVVAALAALLTALAGAWWATRGDDLPRDVKILVEGGEVKVVWHTTRRVRGAVTHRPREGAPAPSLVVEEEPRTAHLIALRGLPTKTEYEIAVVDGEGRARWTVSLRLPRRTRANLTARENGSEVRVPAHGGDRATLTVRTASGALSFPSKLNEKHEHVFHVDRSPMELLPGSAVEVVRDDGVTYHYPVDTVVALAERLTRTLGAFDPVPVLQKLIDHKDYDRSFDSHYVDTFLAVNRPHRRKRIAPMGAVRAAALELLKATPIAEDTMAFSHVARAYFASSEPDAAKHALYDAVLRLEPIERLIMSQREEQLLGVALLHQGFLDAKHRIPLPPGGGMVVGPGELPLIDRMYAYVPRGYTVWQQMAMWVAGESEWRRLLGVPEGTPTTQLSKYMPSTKQTRVTLPPVPAGGRRRLRLVLGRLSPMYAFIVSIHPAGGKPVEMRFGPHPSRRWYDAMDDLTDGKSTWAEGGYVNWGEVTVDIPERLLPAGPAVATVSLVGLPGMSLSRPTQIVRGGVLREVGLSVVP